MDWQNIIDSYLKWMRDNTSIKLIQEGVSCEITTPFLDSHNDNLQLYVIKQGSQLRITDDGKTVSDLQITGMEFNSPKRQQILKSVLNGFNVALGDKNDLFVEANFSNIGQKKHYLLQAILAVNDMYVLSQENVYSLFKEDVELFFQSNNIYYSKDIKLSGKSGFDHNMDFMISASKSKPERLIKTISKTKKDPVMAAIFAFDDIKAVREQPTSNYIIYNDIETIPSSDSLSAMANYGIQAIPWSKKSEHIDEFILV